MTAVVGRTPVRFGWHVPLIGLDGQDRLASPVTTIAAEGMSSANSRGTSRSARTRSPARRTMCAVGARSRMRPAGAASTAAARRAGECGALAGPAPQPTRGRIVFELVPAVAEAVDDLSRRLDIELLDGDVIAAPR